MELTKTNTAFYTFFVFLLGWFAAKEASTIRERNVEEDSENLPPPLSFFPKRSRDSKVGSGDDVCNFVANRSNTEELAKQVAEGSRTLSAPFINVGLPKMGSTTLFAVFQYCIGHKSTHWWCGDNVLCGECMQNAYENSELILSSCGGDDGVEGFMQMDIVDPNKGICVFPQMSYLEEIHNEHPNATFLFMTRPLRDWVGSVRHWHSMWDQITDCDLPGLPVGLPGNNSAFIEEWACNHQRNIREFVAKYPSHALVELDLYDKDNGHLLSQLFDAPSDCIYMNANPSDQDIDLDLPSIVKGIEHENELDVKNEKGTTIETTGTADEVTGGKNAKEPNHVDAAMEEDDSACELVANTTGTLNLLEQVRMGKIMPTPFINLGMPKMGSTSLYGVFNNCAGYQCSHWWCGDDVLCGDCMQKAYKDKKPILASCGGNDGVEAFMQMDITAPEDDMCVFPQMSYLEEIHNEQPNATFIFISRPLDDWIKSVKNWHGMWRQLQNCDLPGLPVGIPGEDGDVALKRWVCNHQKRVRKFVADHPSHALVEINLYDEGNDALLSELFRFDCGFWNANPNDENAKGKSGPYKMSSGEKIDVETSTTKKAATATGGTHNNTRSLMV